MSIEERERERERERGIFDLKRKWEREVGWVEVIREALRNSYDC